jgi:hypothetical protein
MNVAAPRYGRVVRTAAAIVASQTPFIRQDTILSRHVSIVHNCVRWSSSNSRWKLRQGKDVYAREAKAQGLKSRAAFKLLEVGALTTPTMSIN